MDREKLYHDAKVSRKDRAFLNVLLDRLDINRLCCTHIMRLSHEGTGYSLFIKGSTDSKKALEETVSYLVENKVTESMRKHVVNAPIRNIYHLKIQGKRIRLFLEEEK